MNRWFTLLVLFLSSLHVSAARKPKVIIFLADDLGQRDLGCYGTEGHPHAESRSSRKGSHHSPIAL